MDILRASNTQVLLLGRTGSKAYGTSTSESDNDLMAVCLPDKGYYLGLSEVAGYLSDMNYSTWKAFQHGSSLQFKYNSTDLTCHEFKKFITLALKANPNCLPLLFARYEDYLEHNSTGSELIAIRQEFLSKMIFKTFTGYAENCIYEATNAGAKDQLSPSVRKALVTAVRILRMCVETLRTHTHTVNVFREDRSELMQIMDGKWTLNQVLQETEHLFVEAKRAYAQSTLPDTPNYKVVNEFVMDTLQSHLKETK